MRFPFEKQSDLKDCGVCCLKMLVRYYGGGVSKEYLRTITNTTKDGVSAYDLIKGAKDIGFTAYGVKGEITKLKRENTPCIAHVIIKKSYQHFIVIYKINHKKKRLIIADPSKKGIEKITFEEFNSMSTNHYVFLNPRKQIKYVDTNQKLKKLICNFIIVHKKEVILIILFALAITILNIFYSFFFKLVIDLVIEYQILSNLVILGVIFFIIILLKEWCSYFRNSLMNVVNHELDKTLLSDIYHHILSLPYLYYKNRTTGEIISRINDVTTIRDTFSKVLVSAILDSILGILVLITLLFLNMKLTLILIFIILLILFMILIFKKPIESMVKSSKEKVAVLNSYMVETIEGIETIKNQNVQRFIEDNYLLKYSKYNKTSYQMNQVFILESFLKDFLQQTASFLVLLVGSYLVIDGKLDIATLITFSTLMGYITGPIQNVADLSLSWEEAKASYERINELYEIEEETSIRERKKFSKQLTGKIDINNLSYSYNNKDNMIKDINFHINKGDRVLIYGSSGGGKSTLAKTLIKQLVVKNKMIFYDDMDINLYPISKLRNEVCYCSQQESLFTDSIYNNIVLDKEVDYKVFLEVSKLCLVDEFALENVLTYDMLLEENGFNISGGQRQRIILARALLRDANIYILDESLNEVDVEKERMILKNIFTKYPNKTFIVVTHRFHNQDLFNKKYLIEKGISYEKELGL